MNLKIEIDLDDVIYDMRNDECGELKEGIKNSIITAVCIKVKPMVQASVDALLSEKITPVIDAMVNAKVLSTLDDLIENGEMTHRGQKVQIKDYVTKTFESNTGWSNPQSKIEQIAKKFGDEMRLQYNNCFAMNIVKNLSEQGLLNDDVARALLAPSKQLSKPN